jgi:hypothetical protein
MFDTVDGNLSGLSEDELEQALGAQAARVDAELCRLLELTAECERRLPVAGDGTTFAAWLAWRCSLLPRQAREHERIAMRLGELPLIRERFTRGELSYAKVGALTRVAEPANEERLIEVAEALTASQLERAVGAYRQLTAEEADEQQEREFLRYHWAEDGSLSLRARLAAEEGALLLRALDAGRDALRDRRQGEEAAAGEDDGPPAASGPPSSAATPPAEAAPPEPRPDECRVSNAEALVAVADLALAKPDGDRAGGERYQVVVHVDALALADDADGRCELADGRPLAAETARRPSCDGSLVELRERDGRTLSLGRKRRTVSPALRRALQARDRGCRFPGCDSTRFVDAHHVRHWSRGGETSLDNLVSLCHRHHRLVHERGYSVKLGADGETHFANRHGIAIPNVPRSPPPCSTAPADRQHHHPHIDGETCRTGTGERMELALAVDAIQSCFAPPSDAQSTSGTGSNGSSAIASRFASTFSNAST